MAIEKDSGTTPAYSFTEIDALELLQLRTLEHISNRDHATVSAQTDDRRETSDPSEFKTNIDRPAYAWQEEALAAWRHAGHQGIVKVVTGAGKTVMALQAIEETFRTHPELRVSIVVPTIVLLEQWYEEFKKYSNLALELIGRHGGGHRDSFTDNKRIIIWVINSAGRLLASDVSTAAVGRNHLLVVDECHRSGSQEFRRIFQVDRSHSLGLSATPERIDDPANTGVDEEVVEDPDIDQNIKNDITDVPIAELGGIVFELTFSRAVEEGIIPKFVITNYAVEFTSDERTHYDRFTREIRDLERELRYSGEYSRITRRGQAANRYSVIRALANSSTDASLRSKAARYERLVTDRRRLLYTAKNRESCLISILEHEIDQGSQIIIFHEVIWQIDALFASLRDKFPVVLYHSQLSPGIREEALRLYLRGSARIILSARALIEGYNVPSTDVGIIVASSTSTRQRIQTLGRVMRRAPGKESSSIYNIYVHASADENIFARQSWADLVGTDAINYSRWYGPEHIEPLAGPPMSPPTSEADIDEDKLEEGELYSGSFDGHEASVDSEGRIFRLGESGDREYAESSGLGPRILAVKEAAGMFRVTRGKRLVLVRKPDGEREWNTYFVGVLAEPLRFLKDAGSYTEYRFSKRGGGTVLKIDGRTRYMNNTSPEAKEIISALNDIPKTHKWPVPSRFYLGLDSRTIYVRNPDGNRVSILTLENPFEILTTSGGNPFC